MEGSSFGGLRRGRARMAVKPMASINVTSLLDICMVLLIAFMIVAPALNYGLDVRLPEVQATAVETQDTAKVISVKYDNSATKIMLGNEVVDLDSLGDKLDSAMKSLVAGRKLSVVIQGDRTVPWEEMAKVIGVVQRSGVEGVSLLTTPPRDRR